MAPGLRRAAGGRRVRDARRRRVRARRVALRAARPGERRSVRVRATAASGTATEWSDPLEVAAGFLGAGEWVAEPIGLAEPERPAQPALVRTAFTVDAPVGSATLFYTALGVAEPELNGTPVDHDVLAPGWTSYRDRLVHETVDVTALLREGENVLGATIAGAWYTEKYGFFQFADRVYGDQPTPHRAAPHRVRRRPHPGRRHRRRLAGVRRRARGRQRHLRGRAGRPAPRGGRRRVVDLGVRRVGVARGPPRGIRSRGVRARAGARGAHRAARAPRRRAARRRRHHLAVGRDHPRLRPEPRGPAPHHGRRPGGHATHPPPRRGPRRRRAVAPPAAQRHATDRSSSPATDR